MPESKHIIVQMRNLPSQSYAATFSMGDPMFALENTGFSWDRKYQPVQLSLYTKTPQASFSMMTQSSSYILRGQIENSAQFDQFIQESRHDPNILGVFEDPPIALFICPSLRTAIGDADQVKKLLKVEHLHQKGMDGSQVYVAMVDSGINFEYLRKKGQNLNFNQDNSCSADEEIIPGQAPVGHGTMCAFNTGMIAPQCTLIDCAVILPQMGNGVRIEGWLSDVIPIYRKLLDFWQNLVDPKPALVINNSWGMYHPDWDYPASNPLNYSDDPNHPFNIMIETLEEAGIDLIFAAGNCGVECPDPRCQGMTEKAIYGANSHPNVLCIGAVSTQKEHLGYSSQGPGRLAEKKPDLCLYSHFKGSEVYAPNPDSGTSVACAIATGVIAAIRTIYPPSVLSPAKLREMLRQSAEKIGNNSFDFDAGFGLIDVESLLEMLVVIT
jgi:Subtilase family